MKRRLDTLRKKRVVLTNNTNEIKLNEIGVIELLDGKVEVKEYNKSGVLEDIAGGKTTSNNIGYVISSITTTQNGTEYGGFIYNIATEETIRAYPSDPYEDTIINGVITKQINDDESITLTITSNGYVGHSYTIIPLGDYIINDPNLRGGPGYYNVPGRGGQKTITLIKK